MKIEQYPSKLLERAVSETSKLPGVGRKSALRLMLHLLRKEPGQALALAESIKAMRDGIRYCRLCHNICDEELCEICADSRRDRSTVCVVENVQNVMAVEATGQFKGLYHVLGGLISPMDGIGPADLQIDSLCQRVAAGSVSEVILALNPTMEGDTTCFYISRRLQNCLYRPTAEMAATFGSDNTAADATPRPVNITVLARGLCIGDDLEYADEVTLGRSIVDRRPLQSR